MTKVILLPGNGAHNRQWIEDAQSRIGGEILYYRHWEAAEPTIDFTIETQRFKELADGQSIEVFAKSVGTLLAMKAVREVGVRIEKAVFVGTAVNWGMERGILVREWLKEWDIPTLFVHKENDVVISANELSTILDGRHEVLVLQGADHDYMEFDQYVHRVRGMLM